MVPSVSRRSILQTSGVALAGAVAGCSELSAEDDPPTVPILLENRDTTRHDALVEVHSTTEEAAFSREVEIDPGEIAEVGAVTAEEFCIRGRIPTEALAETCPTRGERDYAANGFAVVVHRSSPSSERDRRLEIVKIEDASVQ